MLKKRKILIVSACIMAGVSVFGLWQWSGSGFRLSDAPHTRPDGTTDYAGYLNRQLETRDTAAQETFLYTYIGDLDAPALGELFAQAPAIAPRFRETVLEIAALRWGELAPDKAWAFAQSRDPYSETLARAVVRGWGARDFAAAKTTIEQITDPARRNPLAGELFKQQAATDPQTAAQSAIAALYQKKDPGLVSILEIWAATDREAAIAFALKNKKVNRLRGVFAEWLSQAQQAAIARIGQLSEKERESLIDAFANNGNLLRCHGDVLAMIFERFPSADKETDRWRMDSLWRERLEYHLEDTVAQLESIKDRQLRRDLQFAAVEYFAVYDAPRAFAIMRDLLASATSQEQKGLIKSHSGLWYKNPIATLEFLEELPPQINVFEIKRHAAGSILPCELESAKPLLEKLSFRQGENGGRLMPYENLLGQLASQDMGALMAWKSETRNKDLKEDIAGAIVHEYARRDLMQSLSLYRQFEQEGISMSPWRIFEKGTTIPDASPVADWIFKNTSGYAQESFLSSMMGALVQEDPVATRTLMERIPEGSAKDEVKNRIINQLEGMDPQEALKAVVVLEDPKLEAELRAKFLAKAATDNFDEGLQLLQNPQTLDSFLADSNRWYMGSDFIKSLVHADPQRVKETIETLPEGYREKMREEYATAIFSADPEGAMNIMLENPAEATGNRFSQLFDEWSELDGAAAMGWLADNIGSDENYTAIYESGITQWMNTDPAAASAWLADQPPGEQWDKMAARLIEHESDDDPEIALAWADQISDEKIRRDQMGQVFAQWKQRDAAAAQAALDALDISPEDREAMLQWRKKR